MSNDAGFNIFLHTCIDYWCQKYNGMTIVKGQIESLKRIKAELDQNGISGIHSTGEIKKFLTTYESKRQDIFDQAEQDVKKEIDLLRTDIIKFQEEYDKQEAAETKKLEDQIEDLQNKYHQVKSGITDTIDGLIKKPQLILLKSRSEKLEKNFHKIIIEKTYAAAQKVYETNKKLKEYTTNTERVISNRCMQKINELNHVKKVVDGLYPLIAGAVGENLVVQELRKLSDQYILFNDFSIQFSTPIYNRKENDRIFSIQIDHLLVTTAGIFIIETKNWSEESIKNLDLRSPIKQIRRTNFALFVILNRGLKGSAPGLKRHHWGAKEIPIRSLVVMIHNKPREKFKHVAVKSLKELNRYVTYFDPIFDDSEVQRIAGYLETLLDKDHIFETSNRISSKHGRRRIGYFTTSTKPNFSDWSKRNPGKSVHDYYLRYREE